MLPAFLGVEAQRRDRAGLEAVDADLLVGFLAEPVAAFLDALERLVDLRDELAIAVARAQLERILGFACRALGLVADVADFFTQVVDGLLRLLDQLMVRLYGSQAVKNRITLRFDLTAALRKEDEDSGLRQNSVGRPWRTVNEVRADEGRAPIAGGDTLAEPPVKTVVTS